MCQLAWGPTERQMPGLAHNSPLVPDTGGKTGAQGVGGPCSAFTHYTPQLQAHMVYARAPYGDLVCSGLYC